MYRQIVVLLPCLAVLVALLPAAVYSAALYNPLVTCKTITTTTEDDVGVKTTSFDVCASYSATSPSPAMFENGTVVYMGGYTHYFYIYQSTAEGFQEGDAGFPVEADTNIEVLIARDDDDSCTVTVIMADGTDTTCSSCSYCGNDEAKYSTDCTNIENGRMVECESADVVFFPLSAAALHCNK
jgi:hypothetical protein